MTDIPDIVIKRIFEKLDHIDTTLHDQCHRISELEASNKLIETVWKKILVALGVVSSVISILIVIK